MGIHINQIEYIKIFNKKQNEQEFTIQQYRGSSQPPRSNQIQNYSRQNNQQVTPFNMFQEFDSMSNKMMQHMDSQLANLGFGSVFRGFDDLENEMMEFSNIHRHMAGLNQRDVNQHSKDGLCLIIQKRARWTGYLRKIF